MAKRGEDPKRGGDPSKKTTAAKTEGVGAAKKVAVGKDVKAVEIKPVVPEPKQDDRKKAITAAYEAVLPVAEKAYSAAKKAGEDFLLRGHIGRSIGLLRREYGEDAAQELMQRLEEAGVKDRKGVPKTKDDTKKKGGTNETDLSEPEFANKGVPAAPETEVKRKIELTVIKEHVKRPDPNDPIKGSVQIEAKTSEGETIRRSWKLTALDIQKPELRTADDGYLLMLARKKLSNEVGAADFVFPSSSETPPPPPEASGGEPPPRVAAGTGSKPAVAENLDGQTQPTREVRRLEGNDEVVQYLRAQIEFSTAGLEKNHAAEKTLTRRKTQLSKKDQSSSEATAELKKIDLQLHELYPRRLEMKKTLDRALSTYGAVRLDKNTKLARIEEDINLLEKKDTLIPNEQAEKKSLQKELALLKSEVTKMSEFITTIDKRLQTMYPALNFQTARVITGGSSRVEQARAALTDAQSEELRANHKKALGNELALLKDINEKRKQREELTHQVNTLTAGKDKTKALTNLKITERELIRLEDDLEKWGKKRGDAETTLRAAGVATIEYQPRGVVDDEVSEEVRIQNIVKDLSVRKGNMARKYQEILQYVAQIDRTKLSEGQKQLVVSLLRAAQKTSTYVQSDALQHENVSDISKLNEITNRLIPLNGAITNAAIEIEKLARQYPLLKTREVAAREETEKKPPTGYFHNRYAVDSENKGMDIYRIISDISQTQLDAQTHLGRDTIEYFYAENPKAQLSNSTLLPQGLDTVERFELAKLLRRDAATFIKSAESLAAIPSDIKKSANPDTYAVFFYSLDGAKNSLTVHFSSKGPDNKPILSTQTFSFDDPTTIPSDDIRIVLNRMPLKAGEKHSIATLLNDKTPSSDVLLSAVREHCIDTIVRSLFDANPTHYIGAMHALPKVKEHHVNETAKEAFKKTRLEDLKKLAQTQVSYMIAKDGSIIRKMQIDRITTMASVDTSAFANEIQSELICETWTEQEKTIRERFYSSDYGRAMPGGFIENVSSHDLRMIIPDCVNARKGSERRIQYSPSEMWREEDGFPLSENVWREIVAGSKALTTLTEGDQLKILDHVSEMYISKLAKKQTLELLGTPATEAKKASAQGGTFLGSALNPEKPPVRYVEDRDALKKELQIASDTIREMAADRDAQRTVGTKIFTEILRLISELAARIDAVEEGASKPHAVQTTENAPTHEEITGVLQLIEEVRTTLQKNTKKREDEIRTIRDQIKSMQGNK